MSGPGFEVEVRSAGGDATALGNAGPFTLVVDRPADAGGRGLGFSGGELLHLAVAGCISNDLFREARKQEITLSRVRVVVRGDFSGEPPSRRRSPTKWSSAQTRRPSSSRHWSPPWTRSPRSPTR